MILRSFRPAGRVWRVALHAAVIAGLAASPAQADLMIPVVFATPLLMLSMLIPTLIIEALILFYRLDLSLALAAGVSLGCNLVSFLIGVPLMLALAGLLDSAANATVKPGGSRLMRALLAPIILRSGLWYDGIRPVEKEWIGWVALGFMIALFVPFFFLSWLIETLVARLILGDVPADLVSGGVYSANVGSYLLLALYLFSTGIEEWREYRREIREDA